MVLSTTATLAATDDVANATTTTESSSSLTSSYLTDKPSLKNIIVTDKPSLKNINITDKPSTLPVLTSKISTTPPSSPSKIPKGPVDYKPCLPKNWENNIEEADRVWIGRCVFSSVHTLNPKLKNWYHPPTVGVSPSRPCPSNYYLHNLFLWMPRLMWGISFSCASKGCKERLRRKGLYQTVRRVLDMQDFYYLVTEYMVCKSCGAAYQAWESRMLDQLPYATRCKFPTVLMYKYAVDKSVLTMLRSRTLGNSATALHNTIKELHSEH